MAEAFKKKNPIIIPFPRIFRFSTFNGAKRIRFYEAEILADERIPKVRDIKGLMDLQYKELFFENGVPKGYQNLWIPRDYWGKPHEENLKKCYERLHTQYNHLNMVFGYKYKSKYQIYPLEDLDFKPLFKGLHEYVLFAGRMDINNIIMIVEAHDSKEAIALVRSLYPNTKNYKIDVALLSTYKYTISRTISPSIIENKIKKIKKHTYMELFDLTGRAS